MAKRQTPEPEYVGVPDIATMLGCSVAHARRLLVSGAFGDPVDIGMVDAKYKSLRVPLAAVESWRESRVTA